jgi:hypothetical protein
MMRSVTAIVLHALVAQANAKELAVNRISEAQDSMDKLADKLLDRLFDRTIASPEQTDLDDSTLAKPGTLATPSQLGMATKAVIPQGTFPSTPAFASPSASYQGRSTAMQVSAVQNNLKRYGVSSSPFQKLALTALDINNRFKGRQDLSTKASDIQFDGLGWALEDDKTKEGLRRVLKDVKNKESLMAGVTAPMGFFDPLGLSTTVSGGKMLFYREVELKHGRIAMLASLGMLVGEQFHPLFGGDIDAPAFVAFQQTPLQNFWPAVVAAIAIPEILSVFTFQEPKLKSSEGELWAMKLDHEPGDLGFDPLGLKPKDPKALKEMQNKELNNGRLAMIAAAGMIAQEYATGHKLFGETGIRDF